MLAYLRQDPLPNEAFIYERIGEDGKRIVRLVREQALHGPSTTRSKLTLRSIVRHLRELLISTGTRREGQACAGARTIPHELRTGEVRHVRPLLTETSHGERGLRRRR